MANIIEIVFLWIFSCFTYFTWGYTIVSEIVKEVFLDVQTSGTIMYFLVSIIPFIPILGLLVWGYFIGQNAGIIPSNDGGSLE
jgi:hypothetical protein